MRLLGLIFLLALASCGKPALPLVGVILPLSGDYAADGQNALRGFQLLEAELGPNPPCRFVVLDNASDPNQSVQCVSDLFAKGCSMIIGPAYSSPAMAASRQAKELEIALLSPSATHPAVTHNNPWAFRACFLDSQQAESMATFAIDTLGAETCALVVNLSEPYSFGLGEGFSTAFIRLGGNIAGQSYYHSGDQNFEYLVDEVLAYQADVVFLPGYAMDLAFLVEEAYPKWKDLTVLGSDGWDAPELLGLPLALPDEAKVFISNHFAILDDNPRVMAFTKQYQNMHQNNPPTQLSALTYDAARLAVEAIKECPDPFDPIRVRETLAALGKVSGVTGDIQMEADGNPAKSLILQRLTSGKKGLSLQYQQRIEPQ